MPRYFAFLYVEDEPVSKLLTTAIVILNPRAKWRAHVTVAGPFDSLRNVPRKRDYARRVLITGAGHFRSENQNTVYLKVGTFDLRSVSKKTDFDYNPHITLYDGQDHDLGDELYHRLHPKFPFLKFHVSKLEIVMTGAAQGNLDTLLNFIDHSFFDRLGLSLADAINLNNAQKINLAIRAVEEAIQVSRLTD